MHVWAEQPGALSQEPQDREGNRRKARTGTADAPGHWGSRLRPRGGCHLESGG